jgi:hypothetical protein
LSPLVAIYEGNLLNDNEFLNFKIDFNSQIYIYKDILLHSQEVLKKYRQQKPYQNPPKTSTEEKLRDEEVKEVAFKYYQQKC